MDNQNTIAIGWDLSFLAVLILVLMDNQNTKATVITGWSVGVLILVLMDNQNTNYFTYYDVCFLS